MVIGIKYCGGCNPVYDRGKRVRKFQEANPGHEYVTSSDRKDCDYWMVVCGCSRLCAGLEGLSARRKVVMLCDEVSFQVFERELQAVGNMEEKPRIKVLRLHERAECRKEIKRADVESFLKLTGDENRLHREGNIAGFTEPVVPGMFIDSLLSAAMGSVLPGSGTIYMDHDTRFMRPVFYSDTIDIAVEFLKYDELEDGYIGTFRGVCKNGRGEKVMVSHCRQMMKKSFFKIEKESE